MSALLGRVTVLAVVLAAIAALAVAASTLNSGVAQAQNQPETDLSITKTCSPSTVVSGRPLTCTIAAVNNSNTTADDVIITDTFPPPLHPATTPDDEDWCPSNGTRTHKDADPAKGTAEVDQCVYPDGKGGNKKKTCARVLKTDTWTCTESASTAAVPAGQSLTLTLDMVVDPDAIGMVQNCADVTTSTPELNTGNNRGCASVTVIRAPAVGGEAGLLAGSQSPESASGGSGASLPYAAIAGGAAAAALAVAAGGWFARRRLTR